MSQLVLPQQLLQNMHLVWALMLLICRYGGMIIVLPGIGGGMAGATVRYPAVLCLALVTLNPHMAPALPNDWVIMGAQVIAEFCFGLSIGFVPYIAVAGVQMAGQLSSTSMGLSAGNLIDPTLGIQSTDLSRIFSDLSIILFLLLGGHHVVVGALAGLGTEIAPGSFMVQDLSLGVLLDRCADIFRVGIMISAPVVVALLLTQFVMGLVTRAVPTVNVFVVSFPLTIGIGLFLSMLSLPELLSFMGREYQGMDGFIAKFLEELSSA